MKDLGRFISNHFNFKSNRPTEAAHVDYEDELPTIATNISTRSVYMLEIVLDYNGESGLLRDQIIEKLVQAKLIHEQRTDSHRISTVHLNEAEMDYFNSIFSTDLERFTFYFQELNLGFEKGGGERRPGYSKIYGPIVSERPARSKGKRRSR